MCPMRYPCLKKEIDVIRFYAKKGEIEDLEEIF